jgi:hypothetical protein
MDLDLNSLAFWFPKLADAGLRVPRTEIVTTNVELVELLDGNKPAGFDAFVSELETAAATIGFPCFLRTGHGSGKHEWQDTCYVATRAEVVPHLVALVDWSHSVDLWGLPTDVWAVRELIATQPLFHAFNGMPITREVRLFVRDEAVEHVQGYWPEDAINGADQADWRERLAAAQTFDAPTLAEVRDIACRAVAAVGGGYWSVDCLEGEAGQWWLTDMALGERSFRYGD